MLSSDSELLSALVIIRILLINSNRMKLSENQLISFDHLKHSNICAWFCHIFHSPFLLIKWKKRCSAVCSMLLFLSHSFWVNTLRLQNSSWKNLHDSIFYYLQNLRELFIPYDTEFVTADFPDHFFLTWIVLISGSSFVAC